MKRIVLFLLLCNVFAGFAFAADTIEVWMIHHPNKAVMDAFDEAGKVFQQQTGITVNYVRIPTADFHAKLVTSIAAKQYPAMVIWNITPGLEFSETGIVHEVTALIDQIGRQNFREDLLKMFQVPAGKQWEIPFLARLNGYHYRKDWLREVGLNPEPEKDAEGNLIVKAYNTWDDMLETSKKLTGNGRYGAGFQLNRAGFGDSKDFAMALIMSYGGHILDPETGKVAINSPETVAALAFLKKMIDSKIMPEGVTTWDGYANNLYFTNGTVGLIVNSNSIIPGLKPTDAVKKEDIGVAPPPAGPQGRRYTAAPETITIFKSDAVAAAEKFGLFLMQKDTQIMLFKKMGVAYYGPLTLDTINDPYFEKNIGSQERMFMEANKYLVGYGWPGGPHPKLSQVVNSFVFDDALSRIAVDGWSPEQTAKEMADKVHEIMFE
jgi:ABC-type glycerol-3-phosphate transport system substrate-binding protein